MTWLQLLDRAIDVLLFALGVWLGHGLSGPAAQPLRRRFRKPRLNTSVASPDEPADGLVTDGMRERMIKDVMREVNGLSYAEAAADVDRMLSDHSRELPAR